MRFSTVTSSPGRFGRPVAEISVQVRPSVLVQTESVPMAAQPPDPPATKRAACPGGGVPPSAVATPPRLQVQRLLAQLDDAEREQFLGYLGRVGDR
ncbi:MAG TPA: hypothetical protein VFW50_21340 [Streptosporangiaceae bacterium]|nr:hypothetical protein [Streptosporangiaceae bacterium]